MSDKASLSFSSDCIFVAGTIDFTGVMALESEGEAWLRELAPKDCLVDLDAVKHCNSAVTALLLSWLRTSQSVGKSLSIEQIPESLQALLELGGLTEILRQIKAVD